MQGSTWDSGGKEIFHLPLSQLNKISVRLNGLSSTLEALFFLWWYQSSNIKICLEDMWYQFSSMGQRIGFSRRASWSTVAGVFQGELAKTSPEIAWTPISNTAAVTSFRSSYHQWGSGFWYRSSGFLWDCWRRMRILVVWWSYYCVMISINLAWSESAESLRMHLGPHKSDPKGM